MKPRYISHLNPNTPNNPKLLEDHLFEVANETYNDLESIDLNLANLGKSIALVHDVGKYGSEFQLRIRKQNDLLLDDIDSFEK